MPKRFEITTRSFGADVEEPDIPALSEWVSERKGRSGDIITYMIESSLLPQKGVTIPCAGGHFYRDRLWDSIGGIEDGKLFGEPEIHAEGVLMDANTVLALSKRAWFAIPGPSLLPITDQYYRDPEEFQEGVARAYDSLMRAMRDAGIEGHVILSGDPGEIELELLSGRRTFFFHPEPDLKLLSSLLEHQRQIAVSPPLLEPALDLIGEYAIQTLVLLDPEKGDLAKAAESLDIDRIQAGGYCREDCATYWDNLTSRAFVIR